MRRIMVTGATGGIGRELVVRLAAGGDQVLACGRSAERLGRLPATPVLLDLAAPSTIAAAAGGIERLDGLVHCAGIVALGAVAQTSYQSWAEQLTVNLAGPAELTRVLLPALRVTTVYPGRTATAMQETVRTMEGAPYEVERYLRPATVAEVILAALDAPEDADLAEVTLRPRG
jgi:NAD(P)-dependent dehydrogenase (short-subunit alcohol dehydrogenase family)